MAGLPQAGVQLIAQGADAFAADMAKGGKAVTDFGSSAEKAGGGFSALSQVGIGALRELGAAAINVAAQAGAALVGFMKDGVSAAGDFQAGMNDFGIAAGDALADSGTSLEQFRDLFIDLGRELPVSTAEVQQAAITLVKGGLDPAVVAAGGLKDSLLFAAAAGMDLADAAELGIKMMGTFTPVTASAAEQTAFLADAQNLLVKAAGASTIDVDQLGDAMLGAAGQAKAAGVEYQDFVTVMGMISGRFGSAAEAGTSYKNFLARLIPTTKSAKDAMENLGLLTAQGASKFFDATGAFVGNAQAAELLKNALAPLSNAQRLHALQVVFGNDAMGAAMALADGGAEAYEAFAQKMVQASGVQAAAAAKQEGFNAALVNFQGSVEALQITIGTLFLPLLTTLFNTVLSPAVNTVSSLTDALFGNQAAFASLSPTLQGVVLTLQYLAQVASETVASFQTDGLAGAVSTLAAGLDLLLPGIAGVVQGLLGAGPAAAGFAATLAPLGAQLMGIFTQVAGVVQSAIGAIVTGVQQSGPQIAAGLASYQQGVSVVAGVFGSLGGVVSAALSVVQGFITTYGADAVNVFATTWASVQTTVTALLGGLASIVQPILANIQSFIAAHGTEIQAFFAQTWNAIGQIVQTAMAIINATVVPILRAIGGFIASHSTEIQALLTNSWNGIRTIITTVLATIQGLLKTVLQAIQGDWAGAWETLKSTSANLVQGILTVIQTGLANVVAAFNLAFGDALKAVQGMIGEFTSVGSNIISGIVSGVKAKAGELAAAAVKVVKDAVSAAKSAVGISSPSKVANIEIGQPFTQGIALGVVQAQPAITRAVDTITTHLTRETRKRAVDGAGFGKGKGGARSIGADFTAGIAEGLSKASSGGAFTQGAAQVASSMLSAVKKPLAINSPSGEAAKEIGEPFMRGIIQGVLAVTPDLFKALGKTKDDMIRVFDDLGSKIGRAIQDALGARADMLRDAGDAWAGVLGKTDPRAALDAAQALASLQGDQAGIVAELAAEEARLAEEIKTINAGAIPYDMADYLARAQQAADAQEASAAKQLELRTKMWDLEKQITEARATQAAEDAALVQKRRRSQEAQNALAGLGEEAARIADPRKRAEFLRMREAQISELLDAQQAFEDAQAAYNAPGGDSFFEAQQLAAAGTRLQFLQTAQEAERAAFEAGLLTTLDEGGTAIGEGVVQAVLAGLGAIGQQFAVVLTQALAGVRIEPRALGGSVSSGQPYLVGEQGPELMIPGRSGRIEPLARPAQLARAAGAQQSMSATYNLNVTTQQSMGSIRQDFRLMQTLAAAGF
jgi:TP901 family phage tail tape measure protein